MRASGGTNFELLLSVVVLTKSIIACFAAPLFHDGSGSPSRAKDETLKLPAAMIAADPFIKSLRVISIAPPLLTNMRCQLGGLAALRLDLGVRFALRA